MNNEALVLAINIIKRFEGCRLKAYKCPAGIWTIGYGETKGVREGDVWTQQQADDAVARRTHEFMSSVIALCPDLETGPPQRLGALTSLAYNIGVGAFSKSTVCRLINRKEYRPAADAFLAWNKAGGHVLPGLENRRRAERELYLS